MQAGLDVLVVDTAHGHSSSVLKTIEKIKKDYPNLALIGAVATAEATLDLINAGCDGPGDRAVIHLHHAGGRRHWRAQLTAVADCAEVADSIPFPSSPMVVRWDHQRLPPSALGNDWQHLRRH